MPFATASMSTPTTWRASGSERAGEVTDLMKNGTTSLVHPEIRNIHSPDLEPPALPPDPFDCEVSFVVRVGARGGEAEASFTFSVITPVRLAKSTEGIWGRGRLIMPAFEWAEV